MTSGADADQDALGEGTVVDARVSGRAWTTGINNLLVF
jgi:hypothetical protein